MSEHSSIAVREKKEKCFPPKKERKGRSFAVVERKQSLFVQKNMSWNNVSSELYRLDSNNLRDNAG